MEALWKRRPNPLPRQQRVKTASPEAVRAYGLFMTGKAPSEIAEALPGVKASTGGRAYQKPLNDVYDLIREGGQK